MLFLLSHYININIYVVSYLLTYINYLGLLYYVIIGHMQLNTTSNNSFQYIVIIIDINTARTGARMGSSTAQRRAPAIY